MHWRAFVMCLGGAFLVSGAAVAQEWGFSSPDGAVLKVLRDGDLNLSGKIALPSADGDRVTVPVTGRNEPGKLVISFEEPGSEGRREITFERGRAQDGYTVWRSSDPSGPLGELRAPINVSSEPARSALEQWGGDANALIPPDRFVEALKANRSFAAETALAAEDDIEKAVSSSVAIVTERSKLPAWQVATEGAGGPIVSLQTYRNKGDGVLFTIDNQTLVAAVEKDATLLKDFGALGASGVVVTSNPDVHGFAVPLSNLFDTFAVGGYDLSKIVTGLQDLVVRLQQRRLTCSYGGAAVGMFSVACDHHTTDHRLSGNFFVSTTFTFSIGELRDGNRHIFVVADSYAASAKREDRPGRDRYTYRRDGQTAVQKAHEVAFDGMCQALGDMYRGFRRN